MNRFALCLTIIGFLLHTPALMAKPNEIKENIHYKVVPVAAELKNRQQPYIIEFFNYGCGGCQYLEKNFWQAWQKQNPTRSSDDKPIHTERASVTFNGSWQDLTDAHLYAHVTQQEDKLDPMLFNSGQGAGNTKKLISAYSKSTPADPKEIEAHKQVEKSIINHYKINSVPAFLVNGTCYLDIGMVDGDPELLSNALKYLSNNCS